MTLKYFDSASPALLVVPQSVIITIMNTGRASVNNSHTIHYTTYTGWPNKNRTFFEIPYFSSHYRYYHAVFTEVFRNYSRKHQATIFFKRVLNILCKLVKIWYLVNVSVWKSQKMCGFLLGHPVYATLLHYWRH